MGSGGAGIFIKKGVFPGALFWIAFQSKISNQAKVCETHSLKRYTVRYPVLHIEKEAAPVEIIPVLAEQLAALGFFQEAAFPFNLKLGIT